MRQPKMQFELSCFEPSRVAAADLREGTELLALQRKNEGGTDVPGVAPTVKSVELMIKVTV